MNTSVKQFFAEVDFRAPRNVPKMAVRYRTTSVCGPYAICVEASAPRTRTKVNSMVGSAKITLLNDRSVADEPQVKRFSGMTWAEIDLEVRRLRAALVEAS